MSGRVTKKGIDPIPWLLEEDDPSVRYLTMRWLLGLKDNDPDVLDAKRAIMVSGPVPKILDKQQASGHWGKPEDFYMRSKYKGTVWNIIILAELEADPESSKIKNACEFILECSQDRESGAFCFRGTAKEGGDHSCVVPCLTGNMAWALTRLGFGNDPRVRKAMNWITEYQRSDDGDVDPPQGWPYERSSNGHIAPILNCWGRHTCHMGVVKALKALEAVPIKQRNVEMRKKIDVLTEHMLRHHIHKRSHALTKISLEQWTRPGFPLMWNTDIVEILGIMARLGCNDERMEEAVAVLQEKQDSSGRWLMESSINDRLITRIEKEGEPSKWVTLNALRTLKELRSNGFIFSEQ